MLVEIAVCPLAIQVVQAPVVRAAGRDQHMVDRRGQILEESAEGGRIGRVERRGTQRADLGGGLLEAAGIAAGQDGAGALGAGQAGRFESDPGAAADHDDRLPGQAGFAVQAGRGRALRRAASMMRSVAPRYAPSGSDPVS